MKNLIDADPYFEGFDDKKRLQCIGEFLENLQTNDRIDYLGDAFYPSEIFQKALFNYLSSQSSHAEKNLIEVIKKTLITEFYKQAEDQHWKNCMEERNYLEITQGLAPWQVDRI